MYWTTFWAIFLQTHLVTLIGFPPDLLDKTVEGVTRGRPKLHEGAPECSTAGLTAFRTKSSVRMVRFLSSNFAISARERSSLSCSDAMSFVA
jgi:hypothetical protein